jgi:hypothetical protein
MKIVNIKVTFKCAVSGCTLIKDCTRSEATFLEMQKSIGSTVNQFDAKSQINYCWTVIKVEQA